MTEDEEISETKKRTPANSQFFKAVKIIETFRRFIESDEKGYTLGIRRQYDF